MKKTTAASIMFLLTTILVAQNPARSTPSAPDFSATSAAIDKAIAEKKLPGAVLLVGHDGRIVFHQAYGVRKYAGEPGLDGKPSPAEPMTEDTIFDMASLTKCLATATAIMQLVEQGKVDVDAPVIKYLPEFAANGKEKVTVRELLTHYSGLPPDISLKDAWGLAAPDKAEGIKRAMQSPLDSIPGTKFVYSDVNFITLGAIVEKITGQDLDVYAAEHIFQPLGMMQTSYLPIPAACGDGLSVPPYSWGHRGPRTRDSIWECLVPPGVKAPWGATFWVPRTAPTQHDDQGTKETNPNFDVLLRGTVHDPTTRRMGGVAGHAGVFSTADDLARFAQALLDKLLYNKGPFPLQQSTLKLMTTPEQSTTAQSGATIFTPDGKPTTGIAARGFGWDINSAFSRPRGEIFPIGSFGHTGFTGTSLWMDPASDTYIALLANSVHPRGASPISPLRGEIATDVARALGIGSDPAHGADALVDSTPTATTAPFIPKGPGPWLSGPGIPTKDDCNASSETCDKTFFRTPPEPLETTDAHSNEMIGGPSRVLTGIDVLESTNFAALKDLAAKHGGHLRIGLFTNQTGLDSHGRRTIDILRTAGNGIELVALFSPEHGIFGAKDSEIIGQETDPDSGLKVTGLYGSKDSDKRPKPEDLKSLNAVVIDLQDAGVRFYTYETVLGYFVEASACEQAHQHTLEIVVLDRPALIGGEAVQGPISNTAPSYINYSPEPVRNGMTLGELAQYDRTEHPGSCEKNPAVRSSGGLQPAVNGPPNEGALAPGSLSVAANHISPPTVTVVKMQNWNRAEFYDQTGLPWINPSPNLRNINAATLYPGLGMLDFANISVGRGATTPFEVFGAGTTPATKTAPALPAWFDGKAAAAYLTARKIPGVTFAATTFLVAETPEKYPYHGQTIEGVKMTVTDRLALDSPELGIEILSALHHLYPTQFKLDKAEALVANTETMDALARGDDPRTIAASWAPALAEFKARRTHYLFYP
jgi:CubicO group peptidase (beta-lactamase class C family)/uncharacterized protein YbbC (DUF1343 family)